jgi:hypothetical protein
MYLSYHASNRKALKGFPATPAGGGKARTTSGNRDVTFNPVLALMHTDPSSSKAERICSWTRSTLAVGRSILLMTGRMVRLALKAR